MKRKSDKSICCWRWKIKPMSPRKLPAYKRPETPEIQEQPVQCHCCNDTGLIVDSHLIRDESQPGAQQLPAMQCKACKALQKQMLSSTISTPNGDRNPEIEEVSKAINMRFDTRATPEDCQKLAKMRRETAKGGSARGYAQLQNFVRSAGKMSDV